MVFEFKDNILYLISSQFRLFQEINTETKQKFKNLEEAKEWTNKYFGKEIEFIEEKIDINDLTFFNKLNILNLTEETEEIEQENKLILRIFDFENDNVCYETMLNNEDLEKFNVKEIPLKKGKYYFNIGTNIDLDIFVEKNNVSFVIE